jgi:hypothetical protein
MTPVGRYVTRLIAAMIVYALLLPVCIGLMQQQGDATARYLIMMAPVAPLAYALRVFIRYLGEVDELQRRIQFEAFGFSLGMTALVTITLGFLERAGFPAIGMIWVTPMLIAFWGIGGAIASRRYR